MPLPRINAQTISQAVRSVSSHHCAQPRTPKHTIDALYTSAYGAAQADQALSLVQIPSKFILEPHRAKTYTQEEIAWVIAIKNAHKVWERSPSSQQYLNEAGPQKIDHIGIRTIEHGEQRAILEDLGYFSASAQKLPEVAMQGNAWSHKQHDAEMPMYFVTFYDAHLGDIAMPIENIALQTEDSILPASNISKIAHLRIRLHDDKSLKGSSAIDYVHAVDKVFSNRYHCIARDDYDKMMAAGARSLAWVCTNGQAPSHIAIALRPTTLLQTYETLKVQDPSFIPIVHNANELLYETGNRAPLVPYTFANNTTKLVPGAHLQLCARIPKPTENVAPNIKFDTKNTQTLLAHSISS